MGLTFTRKEKVKFYTEKRGFRIESTETILKAAFRPILLSEHLRPDFCCDNLDWF